MNRIIFFCVITLWAVIEWQPNESSNERKTEVRYWIKIRNCQKNGIALIGFEGYPWIRLSTPHGMSPRGSGSPILVFSIFHYTHLQSKCKMLRAKCRPAEGTAPKTIDLPGILQYLRNITRPNHKWAINNTLPPTHINANKQRIYIVGKANGSWSECWITGYPRDLRIRIDFGSKNKCLNSNF